jgi:hypothetical protein
MNKTICGRLGKVNKNLEIEEEHLKAASVEVLDVQVR